MEKPKNKPVDKKAPGNGATARSTRARFLCPAHNRMVLLEDNLLKVELVDQAKERKRRAGRKEPPQTEGTNFAATTLQRFTVRTLKFVRRLRNLVRRATSPGGGS